MAPSLMQEVESVVADARVKTLKNLVKFLDDKGVMDDGSELVKDFLLKTRKGKGITKKSRTRPPSAYNFFIRDKMAQLRASGHKGNLMRMAIDSWNDLKEKEVIKALEG